MATKDVDLIKERLDLVEVLRSYITLIPAGRNFKALCPFHGEKTPSFVVSPERKRWHCFGCAKDGDVIKFVMEYENLEFPEALRVLAERAGVELKSVNPQAEREFGVLYSLQDEAKAFFRTALAGHEGARTYLASRTLAPATIEEFGIGFAPGGETLVLHLLKKGFRVEDIVRAGLAQKNIHGLYRDKFHSRIMFPLENNVGKTVAFTGRLLLSPSEAQAKEGAGVDLPKYLNSPETPIFSKSKVLFGFSRTKNDIAKSRTAVIMEGQMDFLLAWQTGVTNAVAVSGTGLTKEHLERLRRIADTAVVSFDNDEAGFKALDRALELFMPYDFHVTAIDLGTYKDPGEAAAADAGFLAKALEHSRPAFERLIRHTFGTPAGEGIAGRKRLVKDFLRKVKQLRSSVEVREWLRELATASGVSEIALEAELAQVTPEREDAPPISAPTNAAPPEAPAGRMESIVTRLLTLAFTNDEFLATVKANRALLPSAYAQVLDATSDEGAALKEMEVSIRSTSKPEELRAEFDSLLKELKIEHLRREQAALRDALRASTAAGNDDASDELTKRFHELSTELNALRGS